VFVEGAASEIAAAGLEVTPAANAAIRGRPHYLRFRATHERRQQSQDGNGLATRIAALQNRLCIGATGAGLRVCRLFCILGNCRQRMSSLTRDNLRIETASTRIRTEERPAQTFA
jgi:hypothetical protein